MFCVDEKTAIQALDRLDPVLPLSPRRREFHCFEHRRHGTLSLYTALAWDLSLWHRAAAGADEVAQPCRVLDRDLAAATRNTQGPQGGKRP